MLVEKRLTWVVTQHCLDLGRHREQVSCKPAVPGKTIARYTGRLDDCILLSGERLHFETELVSNCHPCLDKDKP